MKKWISILLALSVCLSLTACASEDEKSFEAANALLEAGHYEEALTAFGKIGLYNRTAEKIYEIEEILRQEKVGFLEGTLKDIRSNTSITIDETGWYTVTTSYGESWENAVYYDEEGTLWIMEETSVEEVNGSTRLIGEIYEFVREEDYEAAKPQEVQITMDNWQEYFEIRDTDYLYEDAFGELQIHSYGIGIFLKDAYAERLMNPYESTNVTFKVLYFEEMHELIGEYPSNFTVGEKAAPETIPIVSKGLESDMGVYLQDPTGGEASGCYGKYAALYTGYYWGEEKGNHYIAVVISPRVTNVQGSLMLLPE